MKPTLKKYITKFAWGGAALGVVFLILVLFFRNGRSSCLAACPATIWTNHGSNGVSLVKSNRDGTSYLGISQSGVMQSTNGGDWNEITHSPGPQYFASSGNGKTLIISNPYFSYYDPDIYDDVDVWTSSSYSLDGGLHWDYLYYSPYQSIAPVVGVSGDGSIILMALLGSCISVFKPSGNSCVVGPLAWSTLAASYDGKTIIAGVNGGYLYVSKDYGVTWAKATAAGSRVWKSTTVSDDGTKLAAVAFTGDIWTSNDSGTTWIDRSVAGSRHWETIASSSDGSVLIAGASENSDIFISRDSGATWAAQNQTNPYGWNSVAVSADGTRFIASANDQSVLTGIYVTNSTPHDPTNLGPANKVNGSVSNSAEPNLTFTLTDPDDADSVRYEIKISTNSDFSSPVVDYTSALLAQGNSSFTVGQAANGGTYHSGASGQALPSGSYYWGISVADSSDSVTSFVAANSGSVAFVVDIIAPVISETTPVPAAVGIATPSYSFTSSEAGSISYSGDCTSTTTAAVEGVNTITFSTLSEGLHSNCKILVTDAASNPSNRINVTSFVVDTDDPVLTEVTPVPTPINNHTPSYAFSINEPATLILGGDCTSATTTAVPGVNSIVFNSLPDGTYSNCTIQARDSLGNLSNILSVNTFTIDTTASSLSEFAPVPTPTKNSTPSYSFVSTEAGTISYSGDCTSSTGTATVGTNTVTFTSLADGIHSNCRITVTNDVGLVSNSLVVTSFIIDTIAPTISEVDPMPAVVSISSPSYTFTTNEPGTISYGGDCSSLTTSAHSGSNTISFATLSEGEHVNCTIAVVDTSTNVSNMIHLSSFVVDTVVPVLTEETAVPSPASNRTPSYTFRTTEAGTISYSGGCTSTTTTAVVGPNTVIFAELPEGSYVTCTIMVTDLASNESSPLHISSFVIDTPPIISLNSFFTTPTTDHTPSFSFTSSKAGGISYGGLCEGVTTAAIAGINTVSFATLAAGVYDSCTIVVFDDAAVFSNTLNLPNFEIRNASHGGGHAIIEDKKTTTPVSPQATGPVGPQPTASSPNPVSTTVSSPVEVTPGHFVFTKILKLGDQNSDVTELQKYLNTHNFPLAAGGIGSPGKETDYFGSLTKQAVTAFQESHAKEILLPLHLSKGTGIFGSSTIQFVNSHQ